MFNGFKRRTNIFIGTHFKAKCAVIALVLFYITLNNITFDGNFCFDRNSKLDEPPTQSKNAQIQRIKKSYRLATDYYNQGNFKLAEKEFVKVLKPVFGKVGVRELDQDNIPYIKTELLNSIYHIGLIYHNDETYPNNYAKAAAIYRYCAKFAEKYKVERFNSKFFITEANRIETHFLQSIGISNGPKIHSNKPIEYQIELKAFRRQVGQKLNYLDRIAKSNIGLRAKQVEKIYNENIRFFVNDVKNGFIQKLLIECHRQLGAPPKVFNMP